jgi:hypothetical protein
MKIRAGVVVVLFLLISLSSAYAATELEISGRTPGDLAPPYRLRTSVASNGRGYVVAWEATADAQSDVTSIYIRVLGADGVPLRPSPTLLGLGREPRTAWNGREYLVVWGITSPTTGSLPTPSVVGMRLREDGSLIDLQPVTLVSEMNPFSDMTTVAWNGSEYLITWSRGMALVDADLKHSKLVLLPSVGGVPTYSATVGGTFIVLSQVFMSTAWRLYVVPVSATGELGALNLLGGGRGNISAFDTGYVALWDDNTNLHFGQLRNDGTTISASIVAPGNNGFPRLAQRNGRIVSSWESEPDSTHTRVCTARFDTQMGPFCSAVSANLQHDPSIATSLTSTLAVWADQSNLRDSVRVLVTPASEVPQVRGGAGRSVSDLSSTPAAEKRTDGSIAVGWSEYNQTTKHTEIRLGGRSSKGETLIQRAVFADDFDQALPAMAAGAGRTMVLWEEGPGESSNIRMAIVSDATKSVIATLQLAAGSAPSVAFDGKEWLAAWQSPSGVIRFALLNSDGNTIGSGAMPAETPSSSTQSSPAVAWSGKNFLMTWRETVAIAPFLSPGERIDVATVDTAGVVSASTTLDFAEAGLASPSVAASGNRMLVSWGTPAVTVRQALFDDAGKQLGGVIDFPWPYAVSHTRTHAMQNGFATFAGSRIALTSSDGRALDAFDVPDIAAGGELAVDSSTRLVLFYSRAIGNLTVATFAQSIDMSRRRASNH